MARKKRKDQKIVELFIKKKGYRVDTKEIEQAIFKRNLRSANRLKCYPLKDIEKTN